MIADDGDFIFMARNIDYIRFTDEKIFLINYSWQYHCLLRTGEYNQPV